jgi:hypothetical protein
MAQDQEEKIFADGFVFKRNEKAPEFVIGRMSIKVDEAIAFIKANEKSGWVNLQVKQARTGNYYVELDTFEAKSKDSAVDKYMNTKQQPQPSAKDEEGDELPF